MRSGKRKGIFASVRIIAAQAQKIQWIRHVKNNQVGSTRGECQILALYHGIRRELTSRLDESTRQEHRAN